MLVKNLKDAATATVSEMAGKELRVELGSLCISDPGDQKIDIGVGDVVVVTKSAEDPVHYGTLGKVTGVEQFGAEVLWSDGARDQYLWENLRRYST